MKTIALCLMSLLVIVFSGVGNASYNIVIDNSSRKVANIYLLKKTENRLGSSIPVGGVYVYGNKPKYEVTFQGRNDSATIALTFGKKDWSDWCKVEITREQRCALLYGCSDHYDRADIVTKPGGDLGCSVSAGSEDHTIQIYDQS
jgi:hypothetical protein